MPNLTITREKKCHNFSLVNGDIQNLPNLLYENYLEYMNEYSICVCKRSNHDLFYRFAFAICYLFLSLSLSLLFSSFSLSVSFFFVFLIRFTLCHLLTLSGLGIIHENELNGLKMVNF